MANLRLEFGAQMTSTQNVHEAPKAPARIPEHVREPSAARRANHTPKRTTCKSATQAWSTGAPHIYVDTKRTRRTSSQPESPETTSSNTSTCPRAGRREAHEPYSEKNDFDRARKFGVHLHCSSRGQCSTARPFAVHATQLLNP